jgi:hypothetical protein
MCLIAKMMRKGCGQYIIHPMYAVIRQILRVQPGGVIELRSAELHEGDEAEVTVVITQSAHLKLPRTHTGDWRRFAGAFNSGDSKSGDNNGIDADLAESYDKSYSLCDAVSFVLMRRHGLTEALTTDHHFEQEGFARLLRG